MELKHDIPHRQPEIILLRIEPSGIETLLGRNHLYRNNLFELNRVELKQNMTMAVDYIDMTSNWTVWNWNYSAKTSFISSQYFELNRVELKQKRTIERNFFSNILRIEPCGIETRRNALRNRVDEIFELNRVELKHIADDDGVHLCLLRIELCGIETCN